MCLFRIHDWIPVNSDIPPYTEIGIRCFYCGIEKAWDYHVENGKVIIHKPICEEK